MKSIRLQFAVLLALMIVGSNAHLQAQVTFAQARNLVITNVVNPSPDQGDLVAYGIPQLLGPGDVIGDAGSYDLDTALLGPTWYFWIDDEKNGNFEHPTRHVFVDQQTGLMRVKDGLWWPSINNQEVYATKDERANSPDVVAGTPPATGTPTPNPPGNTQGGGNTYQNVCIYIISGVDEANDKWAKTDKDNAENGLKQYFGNNNVDTVLRRNNPTMKQVCDDLDNFAEANEACDKFVFYFTGHAAKTYLALRAHPRGNADRELTGAKLAAKLARIKAPIWVMLDCCNAEDNAQGLKGKISGHAAISSKTCTPSYASDATGSYWTKYFTECLNDTAADGSDPGNDISPAEAQAWAETRLNNSGDSDQAGQDSRLIPLVTELRGTYTEYLGSIQNRTLKFVNKTKYKIHDFTISIDGEGGASIPSNIGGVTVNGDSLDFDVDDNLDGQLMGTNENDDTDSSPGKTTKVIARTGTSTKPISPGDTVEIRINLTQAPGARMCIRVQPTSLTGAAIAAARSSTSGLPAQACVEHGASLAPDAILAPGFNGLAFAETNNTGGPITGINLFPNNFAINTVVQLDPSGNPVLTSVYNPTFGLLLFGTPIPPGEDFFFLVTPTLYSGPDPMLLTVCNGPPQPPSLPFINPLALEQYAYTNPTGSPDLSNTCGFTFRYQLPLSSGDKYLQVLYRPRFENSDGSLFWAGQNKLLEPFSDSMDQTIFFNLDPQGVNEDPIILLESIDVYTFVSDSILEDPPSLRGPLVTLPMSPFIYNIGGNLPQVVPTEIPPGIINLPPGPPRVWTNETSTGVLIGCRMPNIDLDSTRYRPGNNGPHVPNDYAGDWNACGPAATSNSFSWMRSLSPEIEAKLSAAFGSGDSAARKIMAEFSKLMDRAPKKGVNIKDFIEGKLAFIDKYKLPIKVSYQSAFTSGAIASPNKDYGHSAADESASGPGVGDFGGVSRDYLLKKLQDTCDVELFLSWVTVENDARGNPQLKFNNGHYVALTGIRRTGANNWEIKFKDDHSQEKATGTRQPSVELDSLRNGFITIPDLFSPANGVCIIKDVVAECPDNSVKFKSIKGKAFKDLKKTGAKDPSTGGFPGIDVELLNTGGSVVATTTTDEEGLFVFGDLPNDTSLRVRIPTLPTGWTWSPPNVGNDSADSDFDPTTGTAPLATFLSTDTVYTFDAGLQPPDMFPLVQDPGVCQVSFIDPVNLPLSNTAKLDYRYYLAPNDPLYYLNVMYLPAGSSTPVWILDNYTLEPFQDTMTFTTYFDVDTASPAPTSALPITDGLLKFFVTDTLIRTTPTVATWDTVPFGICGYQLANNPLVPVPDLSGADSFRVELPPLPPRVFIGDSTRSVLVGCSMPNIDLDSSTYRSGTTAPYVPPGDYAGDWNACGPAATANSFAWLAGTNPVIGEKLKAAFGEGDSAHRKMMAELSELMGRFDEDPVSIENFIKGKLAFIDKYKLPIRVTYQSFHFNQAEVASPNDCYGHKARNVSKTPGSGKPYDKVDPNYIFNEMAGGADVEALVAWLVWDSTANEWTVSRGSHYVTLTGIRENRGNWRLKWKDDTDQSRPGGTEQGISNIATDSLGFLRIPGLDARDPSGKGFAVLANVVSEKYDSTVTFTSTKGRASEDSDGDGLQDAEEASIQGQTVILVDQGTGTDVDTTVTGADGSFLFGDMQPGTYYLRLPGVVPGFSVAPPNQGTNDSLDFDFDPISLTTDPFEIGFEQVNDLLDLGLMADSIVRLNLRVILEGPYDSVGDTMKTELWDQGLLPLNVPSDLFGVPIDSPYQNIPIPYAELPDSLIPVNLGVVQVRAGADSTDTLRNIPCMIFQNTEVWFVDPVLGFTNGITGLGQGFYYPVLLPPGHLPIMPSQPLLLPPAQPGLDLHLQATTFSPFGVDDRLPVGAVRVLRAGETNADGAITADDRANTWNDRNTTGYKATDVNYDGAVTADDRAKAWNNRNRQGQLPQ